MSASLPFALSDQPIPDAPKDRLGRHAFAKNLAHVIRQLDRSNSTVLALTGPWGSGKTSIKNLAVEELQTQINSPRVVEFCPWQVSGTGNISTLFFETILGAISEEQTHPEDSRKKQELVRKYAALISRGAKGAAGLSGLLSILGIFLPIASVGGRAAGAIGEQLKKIGEGGDAFTSERPVDLEKLKGEITAELKKLTTSILLVIDDIDRLPIVEISEIVQLINANANFPNLHYLLLFDRDTVEKALGGAFAGKGRQFLEKIIQASYHVPALTRSDLEREFSQHLKKWIEGTPFERELNKEDLTILCDTVLWRFLGNVRHIKRLISSLSFYAAQFVSNGSIEVNPVDLIALESLRQFEPEVYEALPLYKKYLTEETLLDYVVKNQVRAERSEALDSLCEHATEDRKELTKTLIKRTFPLIGSTNRNEEQKWHKERRVCHSYIFDRYFSYRLSEGDISQGDLDEFIRIADENERVLEFFDKQKKLNLQAPKPDGVAEIFFSKYISGGSWGPLSSRWNTLAQSLDKVAARTKLPKLRRWAQEYAETLRRYEKEERQREEEEDLHRR